MLNQPVRIAILDAVPEKYWADDLGIPDSQKFIDLLQPLNAAARFDVFYVSKDHFPTSLDDYDAILVTGSPCSVHDAHDWIARVAEMVHDANARRLRIVGSCFGHQLIARAFGGEVGHNEHGWVIGNIPVHIFAELDWMQPAMMSTGLYHFNQERVTRLPPDAVAYARTNAYENYGYTLGDNVFCFQGHPEQPHRAMVNFLNSTPGLSPEARANAERCIAAGTPDSHIWGEWMMRFFLNGQRAARRSS